MSTGRALGEQTTGPSAAPRGLPAQRQGKMPSMGVAYAPPPRVAVGTFSVVDATQARVVEALVELAAQRVHGFRGDPALAFALHVGGLNSRDDDDLTGAMAAADVGYADGASVLWLARRAGGQSVERAPTTDIGWSVLQGLGERIGRRPRVALIGGPEGLAARAAEVFVRAEVAEPVVCFSGF